MFQDIEPWRTVVRRSVLEDVDNEVLVTESLMRLTNRNFDNLDLDENTVTDTDFPQTNAFLNEHILPRMLAYLNDCWGWTLSSTRTTPGSGSPPTAKE